jgi:hypothetical protein
MSAHPRIEAATARAHAQTWEPDHPWKSRTVLLFDGIRQSRQLRSDLACEAVEKGIQLPRAGVPHHTLREVPRECDDAGNVRALNPENVALRQQLAAYAQIEELPRLRPADRLFWVCLTRIWDASKAPLIVVRPENAIRWHRQGAQNRDRSRDLVRDAAVPA